jgi:putative effector of murein hydrolase LrgA (UPF0299 family)
MIAGLAALLVCQLTGEAVARLFGLPVPGPVIGMALLFAILLRRPASGSSCTCRRSRATGRRWRSRCWRERC